MDQTLLWLKIAGAAVLLGVGLIRGVFFIAQLFALRRTQAIAKRVEARTKALSFTKDEFVNASQDWIEPDCGNVDPSNEGEHRNDVTVREPVFRALDRELAAVHGKHLLILADSGMGKTSLLLNFLLREENSSRREERPVAIVPLGRADALDQIATIPHQADTVLLLDALDEDAEAAADCDRRLDTLMKKAANFKAILLTCRTQFFANDSQIPRSTGVTRVGPRRAGTPGIYEFRTIYLHPFSDEQVRRYIKKIYPIWAVTRRRQAMKIVEKIPELSVRPMLLTLIPDLLEKRPDIHEIWELYDFMVLQWLEREKGWIEPSELLRISTVIAVELLSRRLERKSERIPVKELVGLIEATKTPVETWKLTARSLLNRDSAGHFKFAHRSVMEFLFVKSLVEGNDTALKCEWTDMVCEFFLSWGRCVTNEAAIIRAEAILAHDLTPTKLFPIPPKALRKVPSQKMSRGIIVSPHSTGLPLKWRPQLSKHLEREYVHRVYELAEGIVWQWTCTNGLRLHSEPSLFLSNGGEKSWQDQVGRIWEPPTITEFNLLLETLAAAGHLEKRIDPDVLYWIASEGAQFHYAVRVKFGPNASQPHDDYPKWKHLESQRLSDIGVLCWIDVYETETRSVSANYVAAIAVHTFRGDAQKVWSEDCEALTVSPTSWDMYGQRNFKKPRLPRNPGRSVLAPDP